MTKHEPYTMKKTVTTIYDRGSREINEDEFLIDDPLYAVFDGATSLVAYRDEHGLTGGKLAASIAKQTFAHNTKPLITVAIEANRAIRETMLSKKLDVTNTAHLWSTSMASIRIHDTNIECISIGDALILAIYENGTHKLLLPYENHDQETLTMWYHMPDKKGKNIREVLKEQMMKVRNNTNVTYGSMNGQPVAESFFSQTTVPLTNIASLVLFTDGLFIPTKNPSEPEDWQTFVDLYQASGLEGILQHVRKLESEDPDLIDYPRFKQHDDVSAIAIDFN